MASLAQRSQSKRVLNASQVQYTIRRGEAITEIVYDRRIGGVVRSVVTDPTLGVITTQSTYESVAGGSVLVSQEVSVRAKGVERTTRNVFGRGQLAGGTR